MRGLSIPHRGSLQRAQSASARWIAGALALTAAVWLLALAGLLAIAHAALANRSGGIYRGLFERQATEFDRISAAG